MKRAISAALVILMIGLMSPSLTHRAKAQDAGDAPPATPQQIIDQIMGQIGQGRIDDAIGNMEGLRNQIELRQAARVRLIGLSNEQGQYAGYDIAAVQKFTSRFQTINVMAYYNEQPVLFRFAFYRPQVANNGKWLILGFQVNTAVAEIVDVLKDTPVDYVGSRAK